jgi:phosphoribosylaminoimidazole-succinocarboxamide synthase
MEELVGKKLAEQLRLLSLAVYAEGGRIAEEGNFLIADTKFEFGTVDGNVILIDEVLTPDSSRYWRAADWKPGVAPESWDKQVIRDYLEGLDWNKQPPAPPLPEDIVRRARERYQDVFESLTGRRLDEGQAVVPRGERTSLRVRQNRRHRFGARAREMGRDYHRLGRHRPSAA